MRKPYTACIERIYVNRRLVPQEVQAAVGLDQFRAHHLCPIPRCTEAKLGAVVPWNVEVLPHLAVTEDRVMVILRKARKSTPFRDLVEYCMVQWLRDDQLQLAVEFHGAWPHESHYEP